MLKKVKGYVNKWQMLTSEDRVIVGVSGGADSVCLLFVLLELQKTMGFDMVAVHVNHGLRGKEADEDENYVKRLCAEHNIPCECYFANVELIAKNRKQSTEEAGRELRKECFQDTLRKYDGTKIALAHHQNDNAETFLFHLARGTGLRGLGGIAPVNHHVIRPLLCVGRGEIETYLNKKQISYRTDQTNESDLYTRNRIRNHILPYMENEVNAKAIEHMNETMEQLRLVQSYLEDQVQKAWDQVVTVSDDRVVVSLASYQELEEVLQPILLKRVLVHVSGHEKDIEATHVKQLAKLMDKQVGRKVDLPYQMEAKRIYQGLEIYQKPEKRGDEDCTILYDKSDTDVTFQWRNNTISCRIFPIQEEPEKSFEKNSTKRFDCDIIEGNICFRTRREGDYITIHPDGRVQKLKSFFINEKVPSDKRDKVLLVACGSHVLWVVGYRVGCAYPISENTKRVLEININEGENYGRDN